MQSKYSPTLLYAIYCPGTILPYTILSRVNMAILCATLYCAEKIQLYPALHYTAPNKYSYTLLYTILCRENKDSHT